MSGASSRGDRQPDEVGLEDVGAELPQLYRRLKPGDEADQEIDHQDDREPVGAGTFHQPRHVAPIEPGSPPQPLRRGEDDVADEIEALAFTEQRDRLAADLIEHADPRRGRAAGLDAAHGPRRGPASRVPRHGRQRCRTRRPLRLEIGAQLEEQRRRSAVEIARCRRDRGRAASAPRRPRRAAARSATTGKHSRNRSSPAKRSALAIGREIEPLDACRSRRRRRSVSSASPSNPLASL